MGQPDAPPHPLAGTTLGEVLRRTTRSLARAQNLNRFALGFLDAASAGRFFLYVHYDDPHAPYDPPPELLERYDPGYDGPVRLEAPEDFGAIDPREREHMIARYDAEVENALTAAAELLADLERRGILDETLVILTADHGEAFNEHGHWVHGTMDYEEVVRIPLLVRPPAGLPAVSLVTEACSQVDVLPTILDYLGATAPPGLQGQSLRRWIEGTGPDAPEAALPRHVAYDGAVRTSLVILAFLLAVLAYVILASTGSERENDGRPPRGLEESASPAPERHERLAALVAPDPSPDRTTLATGSPAEEAVVDTLESEPSRLDKEARMALSTPVDEGRLEGVVLRGSQPLPGVEVHLWSLEVADDRESYRARSPGTWVAITDEQGEFGFDVIHNEGYRLEARVGDDMRFAVLVHSRTRYPNRRIVIYFGLASIEGRAFDTDGNPLLEALIQASLMEPHPGGEGRHAQTWTDSRGAFRVEGLFEGNWGVRLYDGGVNTGMQDAGSGVRLESGEVAQLVFRDPFKRPLPTTDE